ncbi:hypothetical protein [uncultured Tolumonas sp.]|uniref:hypothetical protein n=1 Tax=uncultured Tolumonas sp. TaxID=263765 RepID=UPI00292F4E83|nr:hypothetical protein [uncultured Tolumonas sp.]
MNSITHLNDLKYEILYKKAHGFCDTCFGEGYIPDPDDNDESNAGTLQCPDCHGEGVIYHDGFDEHSTLARELWKTIWRAARLHEVGNNPVFEAFNLMTDSMLFAHMLDMTPFQLFELIKVSRTLLSDRGAAPQRSMLQYKLALRNGEVGFDEDLPF